MLKKIILNKDNEYEEQGKPIAGEKEVLGSIQDKEFGKVTDNGT